MNNVIKKAERVQALVNELAESSEEGIAILSVAHMNVQRNASLSDIRQGYHLTGDEE